MAFFINGFKKRGIVLTKKPKRQFNYPTEQAALERAKQQQTSYEKNLLGKISLFVYVGSNNTIQCIETSFQRKNYLHLTGLDYKNKQTLKRSGVHVDRMDAEEFYDRLKSNDLTIIKDISFIKGSTQDEIDKYFKYTQLKLNNLSLLTSIAYKAEYVGKYKGNQDFDLIINRNLSSIAFKQDGNTFIPISSLYGKANDVATDICPVVAIFSKSKEQQNFQLVYLNAKEKIDRAQFSRETVDKLSLSSFENPNVKFKKAKLDLLTDRFLHSEAKYISQDLSEISQLRKAAFENEEALNAYISKCKVFRNGLDTERKTDTAADILKKQLENETDSEVKKLINEELNDLKYQQSMSAAAPYVMKCEFKPLPENISHGGAAVITAEPAILHNNSGAAAEVLPTPNPFKNLIDRLKNIFRKQDKPTEQPSLPLNTVSKTDNITDKTQSDTDIKAFSENNFSKELKLLNEARSAFANKGIQKSEYTKALISYIKSLDSEEKTEKAIKKLENLSGKLPPNEKIFIKNEIYNVRHYLIEKYQPTEKSWLDTLKNAKTTDKADISREQSISEKENHISKNDCIR